MPPYLPCFYGQWGFDHLYFEIAVAKNIDIVEAETPLGSCLCLDRVWEQMGRQCWAGVTHTETESE